MKLRKKRLHLYGNTTQFNIRLILPQSYGKGLLNTMVKKLPCLRSQVTMSQVSETHKWPFVSVSLLSLLWTRSFCWSYCWLCLKPSAVKQLWTSQLCQHCCPCPSTFCVCCSLQCTSWFARLLQAPATSAPSPGVLCLRLLHSPQQCFAFWSPWQCSASPWGPGVIARWV